eukprot:1151866-Pelagomonas_calceolata.AAC.6
MAGKSLWPLATFLHAPGMIGVILIKFGVILDRHLALRKWIAPSPKGAWLCAVVKIDCAWDSGRYEWSGAPPVPRKAPSTAAPSLLAAPQVLHQSSPHHAELAGQARVSKDQPGSHGSSSSSSSSEEDSTSSCGEGSSDDG